MSKVYIKRQLQKNIVGRIVLKLYHYLYSVPKSYLEIIKYRMMKKDKFNINFYTDSEVFEQLTFDKKSLSRFGDGEIAWIYKEANGYFGQENSEELSNALKNVLLNPSDNLIIGVPDFFGEMISYSRTRKLNREVHLAKYYDKWRVLLSDNTKYADALITRVYNGREGIDFNSIFNKWKKVWEGRDVIIVEGTETRFGVGNDLLSNANSVRRVICPAENAFSVYSKIKRAVFNIKDADLFLIALGPTASVLAADLAQRKYQAIDIGHLDIEYEWFLANAKGKTPVIGKYVNEAGGSATIELDSKILAKYENEIVDEISISS